MEEGERRRRRIRGSRGAEPEAGSFDGAVVADPTEAADLPPARGPAPHGRSPHDPSPHDRSPHDRSPHDRSPQGTAGAAPADRGAPHGRPGDPHGRVPGERPVPTDLPRGIDLHSHTTSHDDRDSERGLRGLIGGGSSQVSVTAAMRARDAARPTDEDIAHAEATLTIVHRGWVPRDQP